MSKQVNLHSHTQFSFLDGYSRVEHVARRAAELGQSHAVITDHGECSGHLAFAKACRDQGIGAVFGMEGYWTSNLPGVLNKEYRKFNEAPISHICLLAANDTGLSNLWALSSVAYDRDHHWYKPLADVELLRTYAEGVYASDGCMLTEFADKVDQGDEDGARQVLGTLLDIYRERFYIELHTWQYMELPPEPPPVPAPPDLIDGQPLFMASGEAVAEYVDGLDWARERYALNRRMTKLNQAKVRFATELGVPLVVVNDSHHAFPDHWLNKELVWAFNTSNNADKLEAKLGEMAQKADHHMGDDELYYWMDKHGVSGDVVAEAIANAHDIAESCQVEITATLGVPQMAASERDDLMDLVDACEQGFKAKVTDLGLDEDPYHARLESELQLIAEKRFAGYFNMVRDYTMAYRSGSWAQYVKPGSAKQPLVVGPGRGSVGGSLVAYLCGIDIINPLHYGTLFSRFLTPGRKGLPDIDLDVPQSQRPGALAYLTKRFHADNVCAIGTLNHNAAKGTLRDVGRALKIPFEDVNAISAHIEEVERFKSEIKETNPDEDDLTWAEVIERKGGELGPWQQRYPALFDKMGEMMGLVRHSGVHPAGILVSSTPLLGRIPLRTRKPNTKDEVTTTQFDMHEVEHLGGVKNDILGLRHLDTLAHARQLIYDRHGVWLDYDHTGLSVPEGCTRVLKLGPTHFADPVIWEGIDRGQTTGIFQLETSNLTSAAIEFKPRSEVDVADLTSIVRPGVADAGLKEVYLRRRAGLEPVIYDHPLMEQFVGPKWSTDTFGILVYQEQILQCVQEMASFTADEADDLRKALGKKYMDKIQAMKDKFIAGCLANYDYTYLYQGSEHHPPLTEQANQVAHHIWASIEASGRYAFNWSHAVEYSWISTPEVWLKHYYPQEFLVALMATDSGNINRYIREARRKGITIRPPDVNRSERKFTIEGEDIRYGLDTVRGVGAVACTHILRGRPYASLEQFLDRSGKGANKTSIYNLILVGAFESIGPREGLLRQLERFRAMEGLAESTLENLEKLDTVLSRRLDTGRYTIEIPDFTDPRVVFEIEKGLVGTYVTVDPMERYVSLLDECALRDPIDMVPIPVGNTFIIGGQLTGIRPTVTKKGRTPGAEMAHLTVSWNETDFRVVAFPEVWKSSKTVLTPGVAIACWVKRLNNGCCLEKVERLDWFWEREGLA